MTDLAEAGWIAVCARDEVADGDKLEVELPDGDFVLLLGVSGSVVAVCADCPHQDTPLAEGTLEGPVLTCPVHFWQWNVETGEMMGPAARSRRRSLRRSLRLRETPRPRFSSFSSR